MFNPNPRVQVLPIAPGHACYVIDDALSDPGHWVEHAVAQRQSFADSPRNAFPGPELPLPDPAQAQLEQFFATHARRLLGGRRTLRYHGRLSLVTRPPQALQPWQWICHRDRMGLEPGQCIAACVLYLFDDPALGGTAFYAPRKPWDQVDALMQAANTMEPARFAAEHGIDPGYLTGSNAWFHKLLSVPARWNRMIFYSGMILHSGEIARPDLLDDDPRHGRLTINGFFTCTRRLGA